MAKYSIIIAEDDAVLRDLYLRKFDTAMYDIRTAENGQVAYDLIKQQKPDLMLLDLNMPVLDGWGCLAKLTPADRTFPVIVLTNFEDQANRDKGKQFNVSDYFVKKDMTIKSLVEMVERLLKK